MEVLIISCVGLLLAVVVYLLADNSEQDIVIDAQAEIIESQAQSIANLKAANLDQEDALRIICGIDAELMAWMDDSRESLH